MKWIHNDKHYFNEKGELYHNIHLNYETLDADLVELCKKLDVPTVITPSLHLNKKEEYDYKSLYTIREQSNVRDKYSKQLEAFGYETWIKPVPKISPFD